MKTRDDAKRTRARSLNSKTATGFRMSDELWAVLQPLLPVHVNTHRFDGGRPRVPGRKCVERPEPTAKQPQGMCLDKGHDYHEVRDALEKFGFTAHIRSRGEEAKELKKEAGKRARR